MDDHNDYRSPNPPSESRSNIGIVEDQINVQKCQNDEFLKDANDLFDLLSEIKAEQCDKNTAGSSDSRREDFELLHAFEPDDKATLDRRLLSSVTSEFSSHSINRHSRLIHIELEDILEDKTIAVTAVGNLPVVTSSSSTTKIVESVIQSWGESVLNQFNAGSLDTGGDKDGGTTADQIASDEIWLSGIGRLDKTVTDVIEPQPSLTSSNLTKRMTSADAEIHDKRIKLAKINDQNDGISDLPLVSPKVVPNDSNCGGQELSFAAVATNDVTSVQIPSLGKPKASRNSTIGAVGTTKPNELLSNPEKGGVRAPIDEKRKEKARLHMLRQLTSLMNQIKHLEANPVEIRATEVVPEIRKVHDPEFKLARQIREWEATSSKVLNQAWVQEAVNVMHSIKQRYDHSIQPGSEELFELYEKIQNDTGNEVN